MDCDFVQTRVSPHSQEGSEQPYYDTRSYKEHPLFVVLPR